MNFLPIVRTWLSGDLLSRGNGTAGFSLSRNGPLVRNIKAIFPAGIYRYQKIISAILTLVSLTQSRAKGMQHNFVLCKEP